MTMHPVVLCGGAGARLWPASRPDRPKQFLPLVGERSSFQTTLLRLGALAGAEAPIVVAGERHWRTVEDQAEAVGSSAMVLIEPGPRDSAPAIAAAMRWILAADPEGLAVIVAADHHVPDAAGFASAVEAALEGAREGWIVTLGVEPSGPSSAYGYIAPGETLEGGLRAVERFVEKPTPPAAAALIQAGYLWNSGNFIVSAKVLTEELERLAPEVLTAATAALANGTTGRRARKGGAVRLSEAFLRAPRVSIDFAVMEKTSRAAVLPVSFDWSDLGAWDAVWAASIADDAGNVVEGEAILDDVAACLIRGARGQIVAATGVRNLAIIAEPDALLICDLSSSQGVKRLAQGHAQAKAGAGEGSGLKDHRAFFRRWLMVNALPLWWALGADRDVGGFHDGLDAEGAPTGLPHRARVQTRQTFAYARAGALGWTGPWREAVAHGAEHLARAFVRPDGLHRTLVGAGGAPLDERAFLYDQAFALLALAERGGECEEEALGLLAALERVFRHSRGGFAEPDGERFLSNPLMHLFEASLAWTERRGAKGPWRALAEELAALALERLIDPGTGALAEAYNPAWRPLEETAVRVWPGHQFEWTWLLTRWMRLGGGAPALEAARRLHDAGNRGVVSGGLVANAMDGAFRIVDRAGRLWPQTERVKAALGLAAFASGDQSRVLEAEAAEAAGVLRRYLSVETPGLWVDVIDATGTLMPGAAPASSFYHLIGAAEALIAGAAEEVETSGEGPISLAR